MEDTGSLVFVLIAGAACLLLYVLPSLVATFRDHPQKAPITVINLTLGWTLIGWAVSLAWSVSGQKKTA